MEIHFDVKDAEIVRYPPTKFYRIFHEASTTLDWTNPKHGSESLGLQITNENIAFQAYRGFDIKQVNKKDIVRHLRWKSDREPFSSYISVSDNLDDTYERLNFYKRRLKRTWISIACIDTIELVPARYNGIIIFVDAFVKPYDDCTMSVKQFTGANAAVWVSIQQLKHDQTWPWAQIHTEKDEWLVGGSILQNNVTDVMPFNGERFMSRHGERESLHVQVGGRVFNWDVNKWEDVTQQKRKHDDLEPDAEGTLLVSSKKKLCLEADRASESLAPGENEGETEDMTKTADEDGNDDENDEETDEETDEDIGDETDDDNYHGTDDETADENEEETDEENGDENDDEIEDVSERGGHHGDDGENKEKGTREEEDSVGHQDKDQHFFSPGWRQAFKADIKSKIKDELREETKKLRQAIRDEVMKEIREEMEREFRSEIEKELKNEWGKR